jgi:hypothetical protein
MDARCLGQWNKKILNTLPDFENIGLENWNRDFLSSHIHLKFENFSWIRPLK